MWAHLSRGPDGLGVAIKEAEGLLCFFTSTTHGGYHDL